MADGLRAEKDDLVAARAESSRLAAAEKEELARQVAWTEAEMGARVKALSCERDAAATKAEELAAGHAELERALAAEREGSLPQRIWRLVATPGRQDADR